VAIGFENGSDLVFRVISSSVSGFRFDLPLVSRVVRGIPSRSNGFTNLAIEVIHKGSTVAGLDYMPNLVADSVRQFFDVSVVELFADVNNPTASYPVNRILLTGSRVHVVAATGGCKVSEKLKRLSGQGLNRRGRDSECA